MYLEKIIFENRAPFEHLEIDFKDKGVNVLTSINGKGKTTILSHITDAFYELARPVFQREFEGKENLLYRISSGLFNMTSNIPSIVYFRFKDGENIYDYIDIRGNCTVEQYNQTINIIDKIDFYSFSNQLTSQGFSKFWTIHDDIKRKEFFKQNILTFFPSYRFELPAYLNDIYSKPLEYKIKTQFDGYLPNQIEVISDINSFANWLLDVLLDMKIYEEIRNIELPDKLIVPITIPAKEKEFIWDNLNNILSKSLSSKKYDGDIRFGIGRRNGGGTRIAIMNDINGKPSIQICPSIFQLSSGELSLISIFGEILHQADNNINNIPLTNIKGIVLIDEIDKHLHITLQKEILPKLFLLFPNIQFIVSSHSPFLNMGLAEEASENHKILDLDHNGISCTATANHQYEEVYKMIILENERYAKLYEELNEKIQYATNPLILTEGKTDIKHILKAKEKLGITDLNFEIIPELQQPKGDSNLLKLLEQISLIKHPFKIIGIFDHDIPNIYNKIHENSQSFKYYGNNVYAFCIPVPESRKNNGQNEISIEYLYSNDEIHKNIDEDGRHLFFGKEFNESGRCIINPDLILSKPDGRTKDKIVESLGGQKVTNHEEKNILATKACFAEAVMNDFIEISQESWENFRPIFNTIKDILNDGENTQ